MGLFAAGVHANALIYNAFIKLLFLRMLLQVTQFAVLQSCDLRCFGVFDQFFHVFLSFLLFFLNGHALSPHPYVDVKIVHRP